MKKLLARALAFLLAVAVSVPAAAQLLPPLPPPPLPGGSLIVTLTSPSQGDTVKDTIPVSASVSIVGTLTVSRVEFFVDGNFIGSDSAASYSVSWNTRNVGNGSHSLRAEAIDILGVRWSSSSVSVTVANDITRPTVTINRAATQADPTSASPINFTAVFSEPVTGFTNADVAIGGTAGGTKTATVSGSGTTYTVAVSGMTSSGTVTASIPAGAAQDGAGNTNLASTSTDNSVQFNAPDTTRPTVTINQASGQADPTSASPINFTVVFSESVTGFTNTDVTIGGTAGGTKTATVSGSGTTYTVAVSGMTSSGTVTASIPAGAAQDGASNTNIASTSTDNSVQFNQTGAPPTVTRFEESAASATGSWSPLDSRTGTFSGGTAAASDDAGTPATATFTFTGTAISWIGSKCNICGIASVSIDGGAPVTVDTAGPAAPDGSMTSEAVFSASGLDPAVSHTIVITVTSSTNSGGAFIVVDAFDVTGAGTAADTTAPTVTINQAAGQADPTSSSPINFTVVFSESVGATFTGSDVVLGGTAGATTAAVSGGPSTFTVAVSGMTSSGTVTASIGAGAAQDAAGNPNTASTSTDATVTFQTGAPPTVTRFEETAASATGSWSTGGAELGMFSGGTAAISDDASTPATGTFTFTGTAISWIGSRCNVCGIASVSIDGGAPVSVDTAGSAAPGDLTSEVVFSASGLDPAVGHTIVITVTGSTNSGGAFIVVDAFDVTGGTGSSSNVVRIEQDNAAVSYAGTWVRDEANPGASGGTFSESNVAGATLTLSFTGTEVRWLGARYDGGGIARVFVDGTLMGEVNTYSASPTVVVVFTAADLSSGAHTLTIEVTGTSDPAAVDSWVIVDGFDVTP